MAGAQVGGTEKREVDRVHAAGAAAGDAREHPDDDVDDDVILPVE